MPSLLLETHTQSGEPMPSIAIGPEDRTRAVSNGSLVGLIDIRPRCDGFAFSRQTLNLAEDRVLPDAHFARVTFSLDN